MGALSIVARSVTVQDTQDKIKDMRDMFTYNVNDLESIETTHILFIGHFQDENSLDKIETFSFSGFFDAKTFAVNYMNQFNYVKISGAILDIKKNPGKVNLFIGITDTKKAMLLNYIVKIWDTIKNG